LARVISNTKARKPNRKMRQKMRTDFFINING
jgi:hypothetical protein